MGNGSQFHRVARVTSELAAAVAALALLVATASVIIQIVMRYQNTPTLWSIELSQFAVIAMVFIGSATAAGERQHFRIDYLSAVVGRRGQRMLDLTSRTISVLIVGTLGFFTIEMLQSVMRTYSVAAHIPVRYVYYLMIYGLASWVVVSLFERSEN